VVQKLKDVAPAVAEDHLQVHRPWGSFQSLETARLTIDDMVKILRENESVYVPSGARHCLENPGKIDLELIEVQTGSYLGEDDIVRFEDDYHRR
jgi:mannose-1-phosphate guanylyltransferase/mannose-6-phosphate isomerase